MTVVSPHEPAPHRSGPPRIRTWSLRGLVVALAILVPATTFAIVSPFGDVDPSNTFYNNIVNMANSGITSGCGGGNFCPKDYVTREQMAAFLNRAAPRATTSAFNFPLGSSATPADQTVVTSVTATSIKNEYLSITADFYAVIQTTAGTFPCENLYEFYVDGTQYGYGSMYARATAQPTQYELIPVSGQAQVPVGPGSHTVQLRFIDGSVGSCRTYPGRGSLQVQVIPFAADLGSLGALSPSPLAPKADSASSMP